MVYVLVINTVKMHIRRQTAEVPLQRWSKSRALAESGATRLQHWEQEAHPRAPFNLCLAPSVTHAGLVRVLQLTSVKAASTGRGEKTQTTLTSWRKSSLQGNNGSIRPLARRPAPTQGPRFCRRSRNIGANPRMASTPAAGFTVSLLCFIYFQTAAAFRRRNRKDVLFFFLFSFSFFVCFELALNSISTK